MAGKNMELLISLKGQIDKSIPESVRKAMADIKELENKQSKLKGIQTNAEKYEALERATKSLGEQFDQAKIRAAQLGAEFRKNQNTAAQYKAQIAQAKAALAGMSKSANPEAYRAAQANIAQLTAAYKAAQAAAKTTGRAFKQAEANVKTIGTAFSSNQGKLRELSSSLQQAGFNTKAFAASQDALQRELGETDAALKKAQQIQDRYTEQQAQAAKRRDAHQKAQGEFFAATSNWQTGLSTIQTVASPLVGAIETAASFEQAMAKVKAITKSSDAELQKLTNTARELGEKTQFSASQAAEAMSYLGMAGWKTEQIISGMPGLLDLAAAGGTDLARTADIISDDLTAFGMSADQAGHMADVFAHTITSTNTNVEMLGETMKYAAPVAHLFGASLEETAALAGFMANSGIKASQAGTALRAGFIRLAGPPKKASKELEAMGVDLNQLYAEQREASEAMKNLGIDMEKFSDGPGKMGKILTELKEKTAGMGREQKMAALSAIFGTQAASGWLAVLQSSPEAFTAFVKELENSDGEAHKMAQIMQNTAQGALTRLKSAAESVAISIGSVFLPMLAGAADWVAKWAAVLSQAAAEHPMLIQLLGVLAAAIAAVIMTALTVNVAVSGWNLLGRTFEMVASSSALTSIGNQVGGVLSIIKAAPGQIGNAIIGLPKTIAGAFGKIPGLIAGAGRAIMGIPAMISGAFTAIPGIVSGAFASLAAVGWPVILGILAIVAVVALLAANFDKLKETATIVFNHISGTVGAWVAILQAKFDEAANKIAAVWNSITGESMKGSEVVGAIINNLGFLFGAAFDVAAGIVGTAISVIINLVVSVAQIIGGVVNVVVGLFTGDWDRAWKGAGQAVEGFAGGTLGTIKTIAGGISSIFDTLMGKSHEVEAQAKQAQNSLAAAQMSNADAMRAMRDSGGAEAIAEAQQTAEAAQQTAQATAEASAHAQELSTSVQQTGQAAQETTGYMQQFQNVMQEVPAVSQAALQQVPQQTQTAFQQLPPMAQQGTDAMVQEFSQLAAKCKPGGDAFVQAANEWGRQAYENIANWSDQMAHVVVDKLSNAWSQISAQFSAGLNVNVSTSDTGIAHNAVGGISSIFDTLMGKSHEVEAQAKQAQTSLAAAQMSNADAMRAMRDSGGAEAIAEAQQTAEAAQQTAQATAEASAHAQELSASVQQTGQAAQETTGYMQQFQNVMQEVPATSQAALQQVPAQAQATFQQLPPMAQQGTDAMVQEFSQLAAKCKPGGDAFVQAANEWGRQAYENIANWSDQMAHVVVDKLSNAWSQISAQFSAGLNVNVSTSDTGIAHNAVGGIYKKGAFLTTFAEDSAEAAIPLDGTRNAVSLWQRAGEILGVLPKNTMQDIPTGIGAIAEMVSPPTEAQMAAAPVALEPITEGGDVHIEINMPSITVQGSADSDTVESMKEMLNRAVRELERKMPDIINSYQHRQRRVSLAT